MATTDWREVFERALAAGYAAEEAAAPARFRALERRNPLDDTSPVVKTYDNGGLGYETEGLAIVAVSGVSAFGRWLMRQGRALTVEKRDWYQAQQGYPTRYGPLYVRRLYTGGVGFGAPVRGYERSIAFARAFAGVVNEATGGAAKARVDTYID